MSNNFSFIFSAYRFILVSIFRLNDTFVLYKRFKYHDKRAFQVPCLIQSVVSITDSINCFNHTLDLSFSFKRDDQQASERIKRAYQATNHPTPPGKEPRHPNG